MTAQSDEALQTLQQEVQRLLGRCLLRLQEYERLIKRIVAVHEISGPAHSLEAVRDTRLADTAGKTLGTMVGELLGSYVVSETADTSAPTDTGVSKVSVAIVHRLGLSDEEFARTEIGLRELVLLRNNLVHHFIDQHDIGTLEGCRSGRDALIAAYGRIDQHFEDLRARAKGMQDAGQALAQFIQSDAGHSFLVDGIHPDGSVSWPHAGIVRALREASRELAVEGWTTVAQAASWIGERYPEQKPEKYGCRSWRQVVHESRVFELRNDEQGGRRLARYREKVRFANRG